MPAPKASRLVCLALCGILTHLTALEACSTGADGGPAGAPVPAAHAPAPALPNFDLLWDPERPDSTEARLRAILPAARASGGDDYLLQLLTQIARAAGQQRKFDEAHRTLDEVEARIAEMDPSAFPLVGIRYLLERGRVFHSSGGPDAARPLFAEAWERAEALGATYHAVDAATMLASVEPAAEAIGWRERAWLVAENSRDPRTRARLGEFHDDLGQAYLDAGDPEGALGAFGRAVAWREENDGPAEVRTAKRRVARALRSLDRCEDALTILAEVAKEIAESGAEEDGCLSEEIGECLLATEGEAAARPHFARAHELLSTDPELVENEPERLARLARLARLGALR